MSDNVAGFLCPAMGVTMWDLVKADKLQLFLLIYLLSRISVI